MFWRTIQLAAALGNGVAHAGPQRRARETAKPQAQMPGCGENLTICSCFVHFSFCLKNRLCPVLQNSCVFHWWLVFVSLLIKMLFA